MLVLARRKNDAIVIPEIGMTINVLEVRRNIVRLGFDAPKDLKIFRKEVVGQPPPLTGETEKTTGINPSNPGTVRSKKPGGSQSKTVSQTTEG